MLVENEAVPDFRQPEQGLLWAPAGVLRQLMSEVPALLGCSLSDADSARPRLLVLAAMAGSVFWPLWLVLIRLCLGCRYSSTSLPVPWVCTQGTAMLRGFSGFGAPRTLHKQVQPLLVLGSFCGFQHFQWWGLLWV